MAGEVIAVGKDVADWKTGDRVCSNFCHGHLYGDPTEATIKTSLGGQCPGVLTQYRSFPAHVSNDQYLFRRLVTLTCRCLGSCPYSQAPQLHRGFYPPMRRINCLQCSCGPCPCQGWGLRFGFGNWWRINVSLVSSSVTIKLAASRRDSHLMMMKVLTLTDTLTWIALGCNSQLHLAQPLSQLRLPTRNCRSQRSMEPSTLSTTTLPPIGIKRS